MRKALILLAALVAAPALAIELPANVGVHLASVHARGGYKNLNPGVYARWGNGFTAGVLRNSEASTSAYAGWTFSDRHDRFAVTVGAISGYRRAVVLPLVVPSVRFEVARGTSLRLSLLAPPEKGSAALHLSLEWRR